MVRFGTAEPIDGGSQALSWSVPTKSASALAAYYIKNRAWDLGEEKDNEVHKFPLNRGDNKPRRCEQHF